MYLSGGRATKEPPSRGGGSHDGAGSSSAAISELAKQSGTTESASTEAAPVFGEPSIVATDRRQVVGTELPAVWVHVTTSSAPWFPPDNPRDKDQLVGDVPFVMIGGTDGEEPEVLFRGQTDARGEWSLELTEWDPLLVALQAGHVVTAYPDVGFQRREKQLVEATDGTYSYTVDLFAIPGLTVRGEVLDMNGKRAMAKVRASFPDAPSGGSDSDWGFQTYSARGGIFQLHLAEEGVGDLIANAGHEGTASIRNLAMLTNAPPPHQVLRLRGSGVLRGRVTNGAGEPVRDLPLLVQLERLDKNTGDAQAHPKEEAGLLRDGVGRPRAELTTNKEGRFHGAALYPGAYTVRARIPGTHGAYPLLLTERAIAASGAPIELRFTRPHLVIRLLDADGQPWTGGEVQTAPRPVTGGQEGRNWPRHTQVIVVPSTAVNGRAQSTGEFLSGREVGLGEFMFELDQGTDYLVGATGPGFDGQLQALHAPSGSDRVERELVATQGLDLGRLRIRTMFPNTAASRKRLDDINREVARDPTMRVQPTAGFAQAFLDSWVTSGSLSLQLIQPETGLPVLNLATRQSAKGHMIQAPVGNYILRAELVGGESRLESTTSQVPVRIATGEAREIEVAMMGYGLLEITLKQSGSSLDDLQANLVAGPGSGESAEEGAEIGEQRADIPLFLEDSSGKRISLMRRPEPNAWWSGRIAVTEAVETWPPGETHHTIGLPAGTYDLIGFSMSGDEVRELVRVSPGTVTKLSLEL